MNRLRLAVICLYYPWPPSVGGVESITREICSELAKRKHEVHVICTPFDPTTSRRISFYGTDRIDGVTLHKLRHGKLKLGYARNIDGLGEAIKEIQPQIVHSSNLHPHLLKLLRWKEDHDYKIVAQLHHPAVTIDNIPSRLIFPFAKWLLSLHQNRIDAFIAHSRLEENWLAENGMDSGKIHKIAFPCVSRELLSWKSAVQGHNTVLYIGRIVSVKGLHVLIRSMSKIVHDFSEAQLVIAGPGKGRFLKKLRRAVYKLDLVDHVEFRNPVFGNEKWNLIARSALLVLPSLKEYTPNVVLEAQALGVPVVATNVGALSEMVNDGETGVLVEPNCPGRLAEAITGLLRDENQRMKMSTNARKFAENFLIERSIEKLEELYFQLLA